MHKILFPFFILTFMLRAETWQFEAAAVNDLGRMTREALFSQWLPKALPEGQSPALQGEFVIYRHEGLTYFFGPYLNNAEADKAEKTLQDLRNTLIKMDAKFQTSSVERVESNPGGGNENNFPSRPDRNPSNNSESKPSTEKENTSAAESPKTEQPNTTGGAEPSSPDKKKPTEKEASPGPLAPPDTTTPPPVGTENFPEQNSTATPNRETSETSESSENSEAKVGEEKQEAHEETMEAAGEPKPGKESEAPAPDTPAEIASQSVAQPEEEEKKEPGETSSEVAPAEPPPPPNATTETPKAKSSPTSMPTPQATETPIPTPTAKPFPTATPKPQPTATSVPLPSPTPELLTEKPIVDSATPTPLPQTPPEKKSGSPRLFWLGSLLLTTLLSLLYLRNQPRRLRKK